MSKNVKSCNLEMDLNLNKTAPVLSQSENAFSSRYHTGKIARGGGINCPCDECPSDCDCSDPEYDCNNECKCSSSMNGGGYYLAVGKERVGGLPEVVSVFDPKPPKYSPKGAGEYPKPSFLNEQKGGAYNFIVNPETGRRVKLNGRIGKKVLRNYLLAQSGGDMSVFDPNMQNREFGCRQPEWKPNCV